MSDNRPGRHHENYLDKGTKKTYEIRFVDNTKGKYGGIEKEPYFWAQVGDDEFRDVSLAAVRRWCSEMAIADLPVLWTRVIGIKKGYGANSEEKARLGFNYDRFWIARHPKETSAL